MELRCEAMGRTFLPAFRSLLAGELVERYGLSQGDVAARLGITQAAVSQYVHAKRAKRTLERRPLMRMVARMARMVARQIWQNKISSEDLKGITCILCAEMTVKVDRPIPSGKHLRSKKRTSAFWKSSDTSGEISKNKDRVRKPMKRQSKNSKRSFKFYAKKQRRS